MTLPLQEPVDLLVIGGGINGCGIARDAAGRGLRVLLVEQQDLAQATSSASTKLFHGGLRYLEYFEFRLVREALIEREVLLRAMPHISWPMRFVLPLHPGMRFETTTPAARLLARLMPWARGRRPNWMIRLGLALYDGLGGRKILPGTRALDLPGTPEGAPLQDRFRRAYEYSDCWVDDARLVVLNARDAAARGAQIRTRTRLQGAQPGPDGLWQATLADSDSGATQIVQARAIVNATGPWLAQTLGTRLGRHSRDRIRLVRGSHIVVARLYEHDKCYFLQGEDGRIIFAIPYEQDFTLIGTTDADHPDPDTAPQCSLAERDYLLAFANRYFRQQLTQRDVIWTYSGVRPLHDEGTGSATAATRDYTISLDRGETGTAPPLLNIFGGKITTYRRLAESALAALAPVFPALPGAWTAGVALPGGDFTLAEGPALRAALARAHPYLPAPVIARLWRSYGRAAFDLLAGASGPADLGQDFGAGLFAREVDWLMAQEYARRPDDILWRRSKLGLRLGPDQQAALAAYMAQALARPGAALVS